MTIYLIIGSSGSYSDYAEWPVGYCLSLQEAHAYVDKAMEHVKQYEKCFDQWCRKKDRPTHETWKKDTKAFYEAWDIWVENNPQPEPDISLDVNLREGTNYQIVEIDELAL